MIRKFLILLLFVLASCGYKPLYSKNDTKTLFIKEVELIGDLKINQSIIDALSIKINKNNPIFNKVILENKKSILLTSKNKQGQPDTFKMTIDIKFTLIEKEKVLIQKNILEEFSYKSKDNQFDLSQYEMNLEKNLIKNIIEELNIYLSI